MTETSHMLVILLRCDFGLFFLTDSLQIPKAPWVLWTLILRSVTWRVMYAEKPPHGLYASSISQDCSANFEHASTCSFFSSGLCHVPAWWAYIQAMMGECIACFLWSNYTCCFQVFLWLSTSSPWLFDNFSDNSFHSFVWSFVGSTWSWLVYGEIPLSANVPNSAHWDLE